MVVLPSTANKNILRFVIRPTIVLRYSAVRNTIVGIHDVHVRPGR